MNEPEKKTDAEIQVMFDDLEVNLVRSHYNTALERLAEVFEAALADSPQAGRYLVEKIHLIAGSRRMHARAVSVDARRIKT